MSSILTLGVVYLALGILVMLPLSISSRKNEPMSTAWHSGFQVCAMTGTALVLIAGLMVVAA